MTAFTGVAAGDATQQSAIFWTRVESNSSLMNQEGGRPRIKNGAVRRRNASGQTSTAIPLILEIATDEQFRNVIARKDVKTDQIGRAHV